MGDRRHDGRKRRALTALLVAACGNSADAPATVDAGAPPDTAELRTLPLRVNDLIFDRARHVLYASIPSRQGPTGNSVATIDPEAGVVTSSVFVGSEPGALALSDDGGLLYVTLEGSSSFRRIDLATGVPEPTIPIVDPRGYQFWPAGAMAVVPGAPRSVVLSSSSDGALLVYDGDVPRPRVWDERHDGAAFRLIFTSATTAAVLARDGNDDKLIELRLDADGPKTTRTMIVAWEFRNIIAFSVYDRGELLMFSGAVYDVATMSVVGRFPEEGEVALSANASVVHFLVQQPSVRIVSYDRASRARKSQLVFPYRPGAYDGVLDLVEWAPDAFALRSATQVLLARRAR